MLWPQRDKWLSVMEENSMTYFLFQKKQNKKK